VSLSPVTVRAASGVRRLVLPSPNGSAIASRPAATGATVIGVSLRNAAAAARWTLTRLTGRPDAAVAVVAAGERWRADDTLRPAVEDLWGAGAYADALHNLGFGPLSPEADNAAAAWQRVAGRLPQMLRECASGRELIGYGYTQDVTIAAEVAAGRSRCWTGRSSGHRPPGERRRRIRARTRARIRTVARRPSSCRVCNRAGHRMPRPYGHCSTRRSRECGTPPRGPARSRRYRVSTPPARSTTTGAPGCRCCCAPPTRTGTASSRRSCLALRLPKRVRGWPTHSEPPHARVRVTADTGGPVAHPIEATDVGRWPASLLDFDGLHEPSAPDRPATPAQVLAEITGGAVHHDGAGELTALRARLGWYPDDVWRYVLACQRTRIGQEEPLVSRPAEAGDRLASQVTAARLAQDVMRLCLPLARRYPPYGKWPGRAFGQLPAAAGVGAALRAALGADSAQARQDALCDAYEKPGDRQHVGADRTGPPTPTAVARPAVSGDRRRPVRGRADSTDHRPVAGGTTAGRHRRPDHRQHRRADTARGRTGRDRRGVRAQLRPQAYRGLS
jgi:hypothetical protein